MAEDRAANPYAVPLATITAGAHVPYDQQTEEQKPLTTAGVVDRIEAQLRALGYLVGRF